MRIELFPFRFRDPVTGKWVRARYRADRHEIAARYAQWEITGPAEIRDENAEKPRFTPHAKLTADPRGFGERLQEPPPHLAEPPALDAVEAFLVGLFLRRYVTYCARRRRFAAMNGAVRLFAELAIPLDERRRKASLSP